MPMPEGRMRVTPIFPQHLISEKLVPLAKDGGGPISTAWDIQSQAEQLPNYFLNLHQPPILIAVTQLFC
jgi:hypothetical protein